MQFLFLTCTHSAITCNCTSSAWDYRLPTCLLTSSDFLPAQHSPPPKTHSHLGHGTNLTPRVLLAPLCAGLEPGYLPWEVGTPTRSLKEAA